MIIFINPTKAASLCDDTVISEGSLDCCYYCRLIGGEIRTHGIYQLADLTQMGSKTETTET